MEESRSGMTWIGVLFVILVIWAIFGGGFGNGFGSCNRSGDCSAGYGGCGRVSNCEVEKQEIIDSASTRYLVEQQGAATRAAVSAGTEAITAQNNRLYIQNLQEKMFDLKMENQGLKGQIYADAKFSALAAQVESCCCGFNRRLDGIEGRMLTRPNLSGVAATCSGQIVPASIGCGNGWSNGCCSSNI